MSTAEPPDVSELYTGVNKILALPTSNGRPAGTCKFGVYLFIDYDGEPIYVGQTTEELRARIRRHLTNQRTDAVAMRVLDPFEVAEIELWPYWDLYNADERAVKHTLNAAEYTVFERARAASQFGAVLNEREIRQQDTIELPESVRGRLLADDSLIEREHPDIRIARRARTIADLARVISERQVKKGIRRTLAVQAQRLEYLARSRYEEFRNLEQDRNSDYPMYDD